MVEVMPKTASSVSVCRIVRDYREGTSIASAHIKPRPLLDDQVAKFRCLIKSSILETVHLRITASLYSSINTCNVSQDLFNSSSVEIENPASDRNRWLNEMVRLQIFDILSDTSLNLLPFCFIGLWSKWLIVLRCPAIKRLLSWVNVTVGLS